MSEHIHLVLFPPDAIKLVPIIGWLKGLSSFEIHSKLANSSLAQAPKSVLRTAFPVVRDHRVKNVFRQRRRYDHNCRTRESVIEKIAYCHNNPVKRGLVSYPGEWPRSGYNWYQGIDDVLLMMDAAQ